MKHESRTFLKISVLGFFISLLLSVFPSMVLAKTIYMGANETYKTLQSAFAAMAGGDTLIIRDGTYTGDVNQLRYNNKPPSGTASAYTVVKAENVGKAVFDGQNARSMFDGYGTFNMSYIQFDGMQYINVGGTGIHDITGAAHNNRTAHHIKVTRCGFDNNFQVNYASYILVEDCYVTGSGRYNLIAFTSDHVIFRRCVARLDAANGDGMPISNFVNYTSSDVEWQNCIAIDSNDQYYTNYNYAWAYYVRMCNTIGSTGYCSINTKIRGSIALNTRLKTNYANSTLALSGGNSGTEIINSIFWDMDVPNVVANGPISSNFLVGHSTFGNSNFSTANSWDMLNGSNSYGDVSNSIFYGLTNSGSGTITALNSVKSSNYNSFYANKVNKSSVISSAGDITSVNPVSASLLYLPQIESGSPLNGAANDGGNIGATILKKIGVSGTLWGETGYNTTTGENLWPWPYEDTIKAFFTGAHVVDTPPKARGFTTGTSRDGSPQTLTKYIWEYLGNTIPADIYSGIGSGIGGLAPPQNLKILTN